ncbi:MAG TPA: hypothetical protein VH573_07275 [Mycobacteriales bacterium]
MVQPSRENADLLCDVREGMCVVDMAGDEVGTVAEVKFGDPTAETSRGQTSDLDESYLEAERPPVPGPSAERLLRVGFLKVNRKGLLTRSAYVAGDDIEQVDDGTVRLSVGHDGLIAKG